MLASSRLMPISHARMLPGQLWRAPPPGPAPAAVAARVPHSWTRSAPGGTWTPRARAGSRHSRHRRGGSGKPRAPSAPGPQCCHRGADRGRGWGPLDRHRIHPSPPRHRASSKLPPALTLRPSPAPPSIRPARHAARWILGPSRSGGVQPKQCALQGLAHPIAPAAIAITAGARDAPRRSGILVTKSTGQRSHRTSRDRTPVPVLL